MDVKVLLKDKIKLMPSELTKNCKTILLKNLKIKLEGLCSKHGYIHANSIELYKVAPGIVEIGSLNGCVVFNIYFYASVCNPSVNSTIKARVINTNRFGVLAETGVLEIIVAKNSVNIESEIDLETLIAGDDITIEIIGKKFELGDKKISIIGRALTTNAINIALDAEKELNQLVEEEGEDDEVDEEVVDEEEEEEVEEKEVEVPDEDAFFEEEEEAEEDDEYDLFDDDDIPGAESADNSDEEYKEEK